MPPAVAGSCECCGREFTSRNKLFKHINAPGGCSGVACAGAPDGPSAEAEQPAGAPAGERRVAELLAELTAVQGGVLEASRAGVLLTRFHYKLLRGYQRERATATAAADAAAGGGSDSHGPDCNFEIGLRARTACSIAGRL